MKEKESISREDKKEERKRFFFQKVLKKLYVRSHRKIGMIKECVIEFGTVSCMYVNYILSGTSSWISNCSILELTLFSSSLQISRKRFCRFSNVI